MVTIIDFDLGPPAGDNRGMERNGSSVGIALGIGKPLYMVKIGEKA